MKTKSLKKLLAQIVVRLKDVQIVTGSLVDTTSSNGWILLKHNNVNVTYTDYEVISAYNNGKVLLPFVSGGAWYVKAVEYGTMASVNNTQLTVYYTLRKKA